MDALCDGEDVYIGAVMQHVEEAGIHSGDSACVIPTVSLGDAVVRRIEEQTAALALELGVVGLMNVQYAVQQSDHGGASIYVLEVNPRGSRTVPFVSKATGVSLARMATRVIAGQKLRDMGLPGWEESVAAGRVPCRRDLEHVAVKEAVLPFPRFPGVDTTLGPEMKSTGEVMGVGHELPRGLRQGLAGRRRPAAAQGLHLHLGRRRREGRRRPHGADAQHPGLPHPRHRGHAPRPGAQRHRLRAGAQAHRGHGEARGRGGGPRPRASGVAHR